MKRWMAWALLMALCLAAPVYAAEEISLPQSDGGHHKLGGTGDSLHAIITSLQELLAGEDVTNNVLRVESQFEYETVAASQTDQVMGTTGAAGDLLHAVHCVWTAAPAAVTSIKDGSGAAINIFEVKGAAGSQTVILDLVSADGGWKLTTSTNMTCIGIGRFS